MISGAKYNPQRLATVLQEAANLIEWNKKEVMELLLVLHVAFTTMQWHILHMHLK
jgi:hypothetical protein